jgi:hypothetical protein
MTENRTRDFPNVQLNTVEVPVLVSCPRLNSDYWVSINSSPVYAKSHIPI